MRLCRIMCRCELCTHKATDRRFIYGGLVVCAGAVRPKGHGARMGVQFVHGRSMGLVTFGALACSDSRSLARVTPLFPSSFEFRASDPPPCSFGGAKLFRVVSKFRDVNPGMERLFIIAATLCQTDQLKLFLSVRHKVTRASGSCIRQ